MGQIATASGSQYTDEQRRQAIAEYAVKGVCTRVADTLGIPDRTVQDWVKSDWGQSLLAEIRAENQDEHIAQYHALVREGQRVALEKLPEASAKDAAIIAATATDKARLLLNQPTSISGKAAGIEQLAAQFAKLSQQWEEKQVNVIATQDSASGRTSDDQD